MFAGAGRRARTTPGSLWPTTRVLVPVVAVARNCTGSAAGRPRRGEDRLRGYTGKTAGQAGLFAPIPALSGETMAVKRPLTQKEQADLKARLLQERAELQIQLKDLEESTFSDNQSESSGDLTGDEEYADAGSATFERELDLSLVNNVADLVERIDKALAKIDEGTYGLCDRCGRPIEKARLRALPYANLCLADKQAEERVR
jgi:RNA polymerase-binding protein DksA